jgi:hypothetical protein
VRRASRPRPPAGAALVLPSGPAGSGPIDVRSTGWARMPRAPANSYLAGAHPTSKTGRRRPLPRHAAMVEVRSGQGPRVVVPECVDVPVPRPPPELGCTRGRRESRVASSYGTTGSTDRQTLACPGSADRTVSKHHRCGYCRLGRVRLSQPNTVVGRKVPMRRRPTPAGRGRHHCHAELQHEGSGESPEVICGKLSHGGPAAEWSDDGVSSGHAVRQKKSPANIGASLADQCFAAVHIHLRTPARESGPDGNRGPYWRSDPPDSRRRSERAGEPTGVRGTFRCGRTRPGQLILGRASPILPPFAGQPVNSRRPQGICSGMRR